MKAVRLELLLAFIYIPSVIWVFFSDRIIVSRHNDISVNELVRIDSYQDALFVIIISLSTFLVIRYFRKKLHEREQFLSLLVDSQTSFLIRLSNDGRFVYVNKSFQERFNYVTENFIGTHFSEKTWHENGKGLKAIQECINNPNKIVTFITQIHKDDFSQHCYIQWEMKAILNQEGIPVQVQGVGFDVTELKLQAKKISKQNKHLKEIAFECSHIIRSPLTNVLGLTEILDRNEPISSFNLEIIDKLKFSARKLDEVITAIILKSQEVKNEELVQ